MDYSIKGLTEKAKEKYENIQALYKEVKEDTTFNKHAAIRALINGVGVTSLTSAAALTDGTMSVSDILVNGVVFAATTLSAYLNDSSASKKYHQEYKEDQNDPVWKGEKKPSEKDKTMSRFVSAGLTMAGSAAMVQNHVALGFGVGLVGMISSMAQNANDRKFRSQYDLDNKRRIEKRQKRHRPV